MSYPPPGGNPPPPGYGQHPQQPGYPPQQGGYPPQQPGYGQQPGYPPPQQPGGYGAPPPPPMPPPSSGSGGGGNIGKVLSVVGGILMIGIIIAVRVFSNGGGADDGDGTTLSDDEVEAAEQAEVGDCMPQEPATATDADFIVECSDPAAFWSITSVDNEASLLVTGGDVSDISDAQGVCGDEVATRIPGQPWTDYNFVYNQTSGITDQFFCLEAIQEPNESDQLPKTPDIGECFDNDPNDWWTLDCGSANAMYEVVDTIPVDPPAEVTESEAADMAAGCSGGGWYGATIDPYGRTGAVVCYDEL